MFAFASCAMRPKMDCLTMVLPFVLLSFPTESGDQSLYRFYPPAVRFRPAWSLFRLEVPASAEVAAPVSTAGVFASEAAGVAAPASAVAVAAAPAAAAA